MSPETDRQLKISARNICQMKYMKMRYMRVKIPASMKRSINKSEFDLLSQRGEKRAKEIGEKIIKFGNELYNSPKYRKTGVNIYGNCLREDGKKIVSIANFPEFLDEFEDTINLFPSTAILANAGGAPEIAVRIYLFYGQLARLAEDEEKRYVELYKYLDGGV